MLPCRMAFILDIDWSTAHAEVSDEATSVQLSVGYAPNLDAIYSLFVLVGPTAGGIIELSFCLVETRTTGDRAIWDAREVAGFVSRSDRLIICRALREIVLTLLQEGRFQEVSAHAVGRDLPAKAMVKYQMIDEIFLALGYTSRSQEQNGQWSWWWSRPETEPII